MIPDVALHSLSMSIIGDLSAKNYSRLEIEEVAHDIIRTIQKTKK
jgi:hypothetical protein